MNLPHEQQQLEQHKNTSSKFSIKASQNLVFTKSTNCQTRTQINNTLDHQKKNIQQSDEEVKVGISNCNFNTLSGGGGQQLCYESIFNENNVTSMVKPSHIIAGGLPEEYDDNGLFESNTKSEDLLITNDSTRLQDCFRQQILLERFFNDNNHLYINKVNFQKNIPSITDKRKEDSQSQIIPSRDPLSLLETP